MAIQFQCTHCQKTFRAQDSHAGKKAKCSGCQREIRVPIPQKGEQPAAKQGVPERPASFSKAKVQLPPEANAEPLPIDAPPVVKKPTASDSPIDSQTILSAFTGTIEPIKTSFSYKVGVVLVSLLMLLLPLIYLSLIGLVGYGVYYHAINHTGMMEGTRGRGSFFAFLAYGTPLLAGPIVILFMLKPFFARPIKSEVIRSLNREHEPLLFAFVDKICNAVHAKQPSRIDVNCDVNASASFRNGLWSLFGSDLVLTIGLPLVAGFNMRQFSGVLAHEFGHFTQGAGMRLTYLIRTIAHWFTRAVYERDKWDASLQNAARGIDLRIGWVFYSTMLCVWVTRRILWVLMMCAHGMGGFLLREMEFDADRHEARLAGSACFESTCRRLSQLSYAQEKAFADLSTFYREGRLGDDLPGLIEAGAKDVPSAVQKIIDQQISERETQWLDSHPADKERIASAHEENAPGVFHLELPASKLFSDFRAQSIAATLGYYRQLFGNDLKKSVIRPNQELLDKQNQGKEELKALSRFFQGTWYVEGIELPTGFYTEPRPAKQLAIELLTARKTMIASLATTRPKHETYYKALTQCTQLEQAQVLLQIGFRLPKDFVAKEIKKVEHIRAPLQNSKRQRKQAKESLSEFRELAQSRLALALELLHTPEVEKKIGPKKASKFQSVSDAVLTAHSILLHQDAAIEEWRKEHGFLSMLISTLDGNEDNEKLVDSIFKRMENCMKQLKHTRQAMDLVAYPFDHAKKGIKISEFAIPNIPDAKDLGAIYEAGEQALGLFVELQYRCLGRLAWIVEQVETAVGFEKQPDPPEEEDDVDVSGE